MKFLKLLSLTLLIVTFSSCQQLANVQVGEIKDVAVKGFSGSNIQVSIKVPIKNNSKIKVNISKTEFALLGNNKLIGTATQANAISLPAKTDSTYKIYFNVDISNFDGGIMSLLPLVSGGSNNFSIKGKVVAKALFVRKTIIINEELKLN